MSFFLPTEMKHFPAVDMLRYKQELHNHQPVPPTPAASPGRGWRDSFISLSTFGHFFHCWLLEPLAFHFQSLPPPPRVSTKAARGTSLFAPAWLILSTKSFPWLLCLTEETDMRCCLPTSFLLSRIIG